MINLINLNIKQLIPFQLATKGQPHCLHYIPFITNECERELICHSTSAQFTRWDVRQLRHNPLNINQPAVHPIDQL